MANSVAALFVALVFGLAIRSSFAGTAAAPDNKTPSESDPCGALDPLATDKFLSDNWLGARTWLHGRGVDIDASYQGEVFTNSGGANHSMIFDGMFNLGLTFDLCRLTGFWEGATLHANALYIYGPSLSREYIGDFSNTSNIAGYNSVRLQELWLQQKFWNGQASIRLGLLAADMEFFSSDSSSLFLNSTFGAFNILSQNFSNAPIYPIANPAVRLDFQPTPKFDFKVSFSSDNEISDPTTTNQ
ncbi:MAG TPA: carbohydrate porin, partial [Chthoniobacteraceae bacterium]